MASISSRTRLAAAALLLLLLALSLGLKLALAGNYRTSDEARLVRDMAALFEARGYRTAIVERRYQSDIVIARRGGCLVAARNGDEGATLDAEFRQNVMRIGPLSYAYDRAVTERPPRLWPTLAAAGQRTLGRFGIAVARGAVIAMAAAHQCAIPADFFSGLRVHLMPAG